MTMVTMSFPGSLANFINISNFNASATVVNPTDATCQYELTNGGDIRATTTGNTITDQGDWIAPKNNFSLYDAMLHVNSGTSPTGAALDTWLNLGTTRNWSLAQTVIGTLSNNCTLSIRRSATGTVLDTATITMTATVDPA